MRRAITAIVLAATTVALTATEALAGATYPPHPHGHTAPPQPAAFTGADISTPLKVMIGFLILAVIVFVASLLITAKERP